MKLDSTDYFGLEVVTVRVLEQPTILRAECGLQADTMSRTTTHPFGSRTQNKAVKLTAQPRVEAISGQASGLERRSDDRASLVKRNMSCQFGEDSVKPHTGLFLGNH